ncbi:unnamed protein product [Meloidogyne enterolobii]|uniref:Uncharacterized protein n=1 Tax=Meloidogyne enterolobii TaxID=390850 RepID=A0ACB0Y915_MELEN
MNYLRSQRMIYASRTRKRMFCPCPNRIRILESQNLICNIARLTFLLLNFLFPLFCRIPS